MPRKPTTKKLRETVPNRPSKPKPLEQVGRTGFEVFIGLDNLRGADEYNTALQGRDGIEIFNKMRKNDPDVHAALLILEMPIINAEWTVEPPFEPTPRELEVTEWVEKAVFDLVSQDFDSILRMALSMLAFGFSVSEKIYRFDENGFMYVFRHAPRLQSTIWEWLFDENEMVEGFKQKIFSGKFIGDYIIPRWKTMMFINRQEADSPKGQSILRAAYKPWLHKEKFEKYQAMQAMRHGVGIPKITAPKKYTPKDKEVAVSLASNLRSHQQSYAFLPEGWDVDFMDQGSNKFLDLLPIIKHRGEQIGLSVLANFLYLGSTAHGSMALGKNLSSIFLKNLEGTANYIGSVLDREWIWDMVMINFPDITRDRAPKLKPSGIVTEEMKEFAESVSSLYNSKALTPQDEDEDFIREKINFPAKNREDEDVEDDPEPDPPEGEGTDEEIDEQGDDQDTAAQLKEKKSKKKGKSKSVKLQERLPEELADINLFQKRGIRPEEMFVAWKFIDGSMDSGITQITVVTSRNKKDILGLIQDQATEALKSQQPGDVFNIAVPDELEKKTAESIQEILKELFDLGSNTIQDEKKRQERAGGIETGKQTFAELKKPPKTKKVDTNKSVTDPKNVDAILQAMAVRLSQRVWQQVENTARDLVIAEVARGNADIDSIMQSVEELSTRQIEQAARRAVPEAFGKGRAFELEKQAEDIKFVTLSAALDDNTCPECERLDRELGPILVGSPEFFEFMPPLLKFCLGGSRCRCLYVATFDVSPPEA